MAGLEINITKTLTSWLWCSGRGLKQMQAGQSPKQLSVMAHLQHAF